jgi:hypothetical protein
LWHCAEDRILNATYAQPERHQVEDGQGSRAPQTCRLGFWEFDGLAA